MFIFTCPDSKKIRRVDLDVRSLMLARYNGLNWADISSVGSHQSDAVRSYRYGRDCSVRLVRLVRRSVEWYEEARSFAESLGVPFSSVENLLISGDAFLGGTSVSSDVNSSVILQTSPAVNWLCVDVSCMINLDYASKVSRRKTAEGYEIFAMLDGEELILHSCVELLEAQRYMRWLFEDVLNVHIFGGLRSVTDSELSELSELDPDVDLGLSEEGVPSLVD